MRKAMAFMYPFLADKTNWPLKPDVEAWEGWPTRQPGLLFAGIALNEPKYIDLWKRLAPDPVMAEVRRNLAITQPILWLENPVPAAAPHADTREIRTPPVQRKPRINGPAIFGVRPGHPFLYRVAATGDRPMDFSIKNLPAGLTLDAHSGEITGTLWMAGSHVVTLQAHNARGKDRKKFRIVVGETIALTPPMGWNSWNHFGGRIDQDVVLRTARAMADSGLIDHGWTYINIDDSWQGRRAGPFNAIQGNDKFADLKKLCEQVHALGLKIGIYSTPWVTSYAGYIGGSAENPEGSWTKPTGQKIPNKKILPWAIGKYHFATNDAAQWAAWGIDYLKYDWNPIESSETGEMADALRRSGRDIVFSLSNNLRITNAPEITRLANCWRTTGDIKANWKSMSDRGFGQDKWQHFSGPGHWNDPDMLEIATAEKSQPGLTSDEQYAHMTLWCLDCAPLLLGNDLTQMDSFTLNLLENDEVLAINQDSLGDQARCIAQDGDTRIYCKKMEDGSLAVGLFNVGTNGARTVTVNFADLGIHGRRLIRDLWRQKDLGKHRETFSMRVAAHGAELVRIFR
jgi:alpha-galactosidase